MQLERIARMYVPLSAQGLRFDGEYTEIPPCPALTPYVRCFWGSLHARRSCGGSRVIPNSCMDLVFEINYTKNRVTGRFCALDDAAYVTPDRSSQDIISSFGIRFYAWTAACFAEADFRDALGRVFDPEAHFSSLFHALSPRLFEPDDLAARARLAEAELLRRLRPERPENALMNVIYAMISGCGREKVGEIAARAGISGRKMERKLLELTGAGPKLLNQLIRHQLIYREVLEGRYRALDAVEKYGYADQSHLLRDFRRFQGVLPGELLWKNDESCRISSIHEGDI
ncbi:MAG: helix-turn-helix domain-containing protein [Aristaeellaceae bacterium]